MFQLRLRFSLSVMLVACAWSAQAQITLLHEFGSVTGDGNTPQSRLVLDGSTLYGTTLNGGFSNQGILFSVGTDGSNYGVEYDFFISDSGRHPEGNLAIDGTTLYGISPNGGTTGITSKGTVFSIDTIGSPPDHDDIVYEFSGGVNDGERPTGGVLRIGSTLYGMTINGGDSNEGTIYSVGTDGMGFTLLHEFGSITDDGFSPNAGLVHADGKLFGTTQAGGGIDGNGVLFSIDLNGSNYTIVRAFTTDTEGESPEGAFPGGIIADGTTIYGVADAGGADEAGAIYKINTDGTGFSVLHSFEEDIFEEYPNGGFPRNAMAISGTTLVGTTSLGGGDDSGIVFSLETDGSAFQVLHEFSGGPDDGASPEASVIIDGNKIYGTTRNGGDFGSGTVYSLPFTGGGPTFRAADFNTDTFVNAADLTQWQGAYGIHAMADADSDNDSDGADFLVWQRQFGLPPLVSAAVSAVPEPCGLLLVMFATLSLGTTCRIFRYSNS